MGYGINKLIVEFFTTGHHPVFVQYVVNYLINNTDNTQYIFLLNEKYKPLYNELRIQNVKFEFVKQIEVDKLNGASVFRKSLNFSNYVHNYALKNNVSDVILLDMNIFQLGLIFKTKILYRGIIFSQFFRQDKSKSLKNRIRFFKRYTLIKLLVRNRFIKNIYFLNDNNGVQDANNLLKTNKLISISDPVEEFDPSIITELRTVYQIPTDHKIFLHYGSMDYRKGSLLILQALLDINDQLYNNVTLIYAGKSNKPQLNQDIVNCINELSKKGLNIVFINDYIDKSLTQSLFTVADYCLCPYSSTEASSGCVGLSIASNTIIIGPEEGLLGEIIKESGIGIVIQDIDKMKLTKLFIELFSKQKPSLISKIDIKSRSPYVFAKELLK